MKPFVCVSLSLYSHHGKTNPHERRHATQRALESESGKFIDYTDSQTTQTQYKIQHTSLYAPTATRDYVRISLTSQNCARKSVTSLQLQRFHHMRPLAMGKTALVFLNVDPVLETQYLCTRKKTFVKTRSYAVQRDAAKWDRKNSIAIIRNSSCTFYKQEIPQSWTLEDLLAVRLVKRWSQPRSTPRWRARLTRIAFAVD